MKKPILSIRHLACAIPAIACCGLPVAVAQDFLLAPSSSDGGLSPAPTQPPLNLGSFNIIINPGSGLSSNTTALAAFNRAANQWKAFFTDPITITINADLGTLGSGIIGSASSVVLQADYDTIRDQLVADSLGKPGKEIVSFLPTAAQFSANIPSGTSLTGLMATKANLKAIGFSGLDTSFGASDAAITFSSAFAFDYDNSDGVTAGMMDFETVAAHEIGHALGFFSAVDSADVGATSFNISLLDLYRFQDGSANDPSTPSEFTTFARDLVPGHEAIFDDTTNEWRMSTGQTMGDGRQASHWKDNLTGTLLGAMDPTLAFGQKFTITAADLRVFSLIGYDVIPEPSTLLSVAAFCVVLLGRRKRRGQ